MKKNLFVLILVLTGSVFPQSRISISTLGGVNYIPMKEFSNYLSNFNNSKSDKFGFSGYLKLQYNIDSRNSLFLGGEFISTNASFEGGFVSMIWIFEAIPITIGYEYRFKTSEKNWSPYLGAGVSYILQNSTIKYLGDDGTFVESVTSNTFGFEIKFGVEKSIIENLSFVSEVKYRYMGDIRLRKYSFAEKTNLSGIGLQLGLKLTFE